MKNSSFVTRIKLVGLSSFIPREVKMPEYQIFVRLLETNSTEIKFRLCMPLRWMYMSLTTFLLFTTTAPRSDAFEIKLLPSNKTDCYGSSWRINLADKDIGFSDFVHRPDFS
jgi:hypothetical protein